MKAIGLTKYLPITDEASLVDIELPKPEPQGHDLLVSVRAISVNPVDTKVRAPKDGVEDPPRVLGWDAAGVVEAVLVETGDAVRAEQELARLDVTRLAADLEAAGEQRRAGGGIPAAVQGQMAAEEAGI